MLHLCIYCLSSWFTVPLQMYAYFIQECKQRVSLFLHFEGNWDLHTHMHRSRHFEFRNRRYVSHYYDLSHHTWSSLFGHLVNWTITSEAPLNFKLLFWGSSELYPPTSQFSHSVLILWMYSFSPHYCCFVKKSASLKDPIIQSKSLSLKIVQYICSWLMEKLLQN